MSKTLFYRPVTVFVYTKPAINYVGELQKKELCKGRFLEFGVEFEECKNGVGSFTVGIVEKDDGEVICVPVNLLRFDDE